ncbi:hypothetical protein C404_12065 [Ralstonia sp. AU12-08]|nr:hypothetical protein C404_12065 [Ralstonia sp. AU12-08]
MCGNPRKYQRQRTISERRWYQSVGDEGEPSASATY